MKRHEAFVPLSRDHHDGLLLAVRLQQGTQALQRLWSHDPAWQAEYVVRFFHERLANHFAIEEEILFPAAAEHLPPDGIGLIGILKKEHQELGRLAGALKSDSPRILPQHLMEFGETLERHVHTEERRFFPLCERHLPAQLLGDIGTKIASAHNRKTSS